MGLSISGHSQVCRLYIQSRGIYWATVVKKQRQGGLIWPWPCVQGVKARRGMAEVNKANQQSRAHSPHLLNHQRLAEAAHVTVSRPLSIPTRQDNATRGNQAMRKCTRRGYESVALISERLVWIVQCKKYNI